MDNNSFLNRLATCELSILQNIVILIMYTYIYNGIYVKRWHKAINFNQSHRPNQRKNKYNKLCKYKNPFGVWKYNYTH